MRRATLLSVVVALAVPAVLLGNGLWLLTNGWYVHAEYARPGFPDDTLGFTKAERTELALVGLDSIHPAQPGRRRRSPRRTVARRERRLHRARDRPHGRRARARRQGAPRARDRARSRSSSWDRRAGGAVSRSRLARHSSAGSLLTPRSRRGARPDDADLVRLVLRPVSRGALHRRHVALRRTRTRCSASTRTPSGATSAAFSQRLTVVQAAALAGGLWWWRRRARARDVSPVTRTETAPGSS